MRLFYVVITMSKSLSELAEEYKANAEYIEQKIKELEAEADNNPAAVNHTLAVYRDIHRDLMSTYRTLNNYYK